MPKRCERHPAFVHLDCHAGLPVAVLITHVKDLSVHVPTLWGQQDTMRAGYVNLSDVRRFMFGILLESLVRGAWRYGFEA